MVQISVQSPLFLDECFPGGNAPTTAWPRPMAPGYVLGIQVVQAAAATGRPATFPACGLPECREP